MQDRTGYQCKNCLRIFTVLLLTRVMFSPVSTPTVRADTLPDEFLYITPEDQEVFRLWRLDLPPHTPSPGPPPLDYFNWHEVEETDPNGNPIEVSYVPRPNWAQHGGTCFMFAPLGAFEVKTAIEAVRQGWWDPGFETDRSFRLSPLNVFICDKCVGFFSGSAGEPAAWLREFGTVDNCLEPRADSKITSGFGRRSIPTCCVARRFNTSMYSPSSRLAGRAPRRPRSCDLILESALMCLRGMGGRGCRR